MNQPASSLKNSVGGGDVDHAVEPEPDDATQQSKTPVDRTSRWAIWIGSLGAIAVFGSWLMPRVLFIFHTFANFHLQLVCMVVLAAIVLIRKQRLVTGAFLLLLVVVPVINLSKLYAPAVPVETSTRSIRLMTFNVLKSNNRFDETLDMIRKSDPDVVGLIEFSFPWQEAFAGKLDDLYPYQVGPKMGKVIYSKLPIEERQTAISNSNPWFNAWMESRFWVDDQLVHFVLTHTTSPKNHGRLVERNGQFMGLSQRSEFLANYMHVVVAGDFNGTTNDFELQSFLEHTGFKDSRQGFGWMNSWPTWCWPISICIDHCFVSPGVDVLDRIRGPNVGSDHLPVIVELAFATHDKKLDAARQGPPKK